MANQLPFVSNKHQKKIIVLLGIFVLFSITLVLSKNKKIQIKNKKG